MLNKFEIESVNLTSSTNKSFDSSMKQNMGQLLTVQCSSPKRNSKKTAFTQYGIQKNDNFGKFSKFLGIPAGNFMDHRFPGTGIPSGPDPQPSFQTQLGIPTL